MLLEEGSGSAPSLCELLLSGFRSWDSSNVVWDMLACAYSRFEMVHDALFVLVKMKDLNLGASIQTYNSLLYNLRHTNIMWDVYNEIKLSGTPQSKYTSSIVVDGLCRQSRFQDAVLFLRHIEGKEFGPSVVSFNTIMSRSNGSMEEALEFTNDMEKHGVQPDIVTYNILAKGFCLLGNIEEALKLRKEMISRGFQLNIISYTVLLSCLCKSGRVDEALKLFCEMRANGLQPDLISYSILIHGLCKQGEVQQAIQLYGEMCLSGIFPNSLAHRAILMGLCEKGMMSKARLYFDSLVKSNLTLDVILYNIMIDRKVDEARKLLDTIKLHGLEPTAVTYTTLMNAYCEKVIKGLCKRWRLQESCQLLEEMHAKGLTPDQITYNTIIQAFCKAKDMIKAFQLFDEMLMHNLEPTSATCNILINGLCVYGDLKDADSLLVSLQDQKINLNKFAYTTMIKAHCAKGDPNRAAIYFRQMVEKGFEVSIRDYSAVISRLCKRCLMTEAKYFFCLMLSYGVSPDEEICEVMLNAFHRGGHLSSVFELLAEMIKFGLVRD
ncbi:hypothetical protein GH714_043255 [Hevea brasiliensis]|uniref:Pentacotripeptide-repeat region of PRORP domain-containing protein n=1 Tax=Hevea brasiliensis TaxID=3981 RepID=A0A6A6K425_HEVBR|nr:hypothetical protein GH714_043255 [Hevea brasiliensis]